MAKARKETLVCRPCGYGVTISDLGTAVVECYECGMELVPAKPAAARTALAAKGGAKKPAAKRPKAKKPPAKPRAAKKPAARKK